MAGTASGMIFEKRGANIDATLFKGKTINFSLIWGGADPIDVTGYSASLNVKALDGSAYSAADFTVANSRVTIGTTDGSISFLMSASDSAALTAGNYTYEIEVVDGDSTEMLAMSGKLQIK